MSILLSRSDPGCFAPSGQQAATRSCLNNDYALKKLIAYLDKVIPTHKRAYENTDYELHNGSHKACKNIRARIDEYLKRAK